MNKDRPSPMDIDARLIPRDWANRPADLLIEFTAGDSSAPKPRKKIDYLGALEGYEKTSFWRRRFGSPLEVFFAAGPRLILAMAILSGFAGWCMINKGKAISNLMQGSAAVDQLKPLRVAMVPDVLCDAESSFRALVAGMILCLSVFFTGASMRYASSWGRGYCCWAQYFMTARMRFGWFRGQQRVCC